MDVYRNFPDFQLTYKQSYVMFINLERLALQPPFILNSTQNYKFSAN